MGMLEGHSTCTGVRVSIPPAQETTVTDIIVAPYCSLLNVRVNVASENLGDSLDIILNPATNVGTTTAAIAIGDNTFNADSDTVYAAGYGRYLTLLHTDGTTKNDVGQIVIYSDTGVTITTNAATTSAFPQGSALLIDKYIAKNLVLHVPGTEDAMIPGVVSYNMDAGSVIRFVYTNANQAAKTFSANYFTTAW